MRNVCLAVPLLCLGLLGPHAARADETVSKFLQTAQEPLGREGAETLLAGINSGFMQVNSYLADTRHEPPIYCVPEQLALTRDQLLSLLTKGAEDDSRMGDMTVPAALLAVMKKTFPCATTAK